MQRVKRYIIVRDASRAVQVGVHRPHNRKSGLGNLHCIAIASLFD
jgi:hypothetical protein